jgi:hypothetical protein
VLLISGLAANAVYDDFTVAGGGSYGYKIRAYGTGDTFSESGTFAAIVPSVVNDYLSFVDGTGAVSLTRLPKKSQHASRQAAVLHFDGLAYPRAYFGESQDESWDVEYRVVNTTDGDQWAALRALVSSGSVLMWRDSSGQIVYCIVSSTADRMPMLPFPQPINDLKFTLTRVTYP